MLRHDLHNFVRTCGVNRVDQNQKTKKKIRIFHIPIVPRITATIEDQRERTHQYSWKSNAM